MRRMKTRERAGMKMAPESAPDFLSEGCQVAPIQGPFRGRKAAPILKTLI